MAKNEHDSLAAAVASILGSKSTLPPAVTLSSPDWQAALNQWLTQRGLALRVQRGAVRPYGDCEHEQWVGIVKRGGELHAVVLGIGDDYLPTMVFDPSGRSASPDEDVIVGSLHFYDPDGDPWRGY